MKNRRLPKAFYLVRVNVQASGTHLRTYDKKGGNYTQLKAAVAQASRMKTMGHLVELWEHNVDEAGWKELDLEEAIERVS